MKIAQVSPLYESVPPKLYGGTERVVSYLTEELVKQGHQVTLFASGDSITDAELVAPCQQALRLNKDVIDPLAYHILQMEWVIREGERFDVIHFHTDYLHFPFSRRSDKPQLTTLHGRLDIPDLQPLYREFSEMPIVSISNSQRIPLLNANWFGTVYHGLPTDLFQPGNGDGGYLAFLGRISPEKRVDRAIHIAIQAGIPLKIAAKVDNADKAYYEKHIKPLLDHPLIEFIGEIGQRQKNDFLGNALALLFPIDWPEPFGLVMIEAMACGTPVIAYHHGSVPEVIEDGVTGYIVHSQDEAVRTVGKLHLINRKTCRQVFEERFSATRMANDYLKLYEQVAFAQKASYYSMAM